MIDTEKAGRIAQIDRERAKNKEVDDKLLEERRALEAELLEQFEESEAQRITVAGRTVYLRRELWANAAKDEHGNRNYDAAVEALRAAGLESFVQTRFNTQTLSGYVRNDLPQTEDGMPILPPELEGVIDVAEVFSIRSREG